MAFLQRLADSVTSADFLALFVTASGVLMLNVLCRYLEKFHLLSNPSARAQTHFDSWRLGVDLAVLGIVALVGVLKAASTKTSGAQYAQLFESFTSLLIINFVLLLGAVLANMKFASPTNFWSGILIPNAIGVVAVALALAYFNAWIR